MTPLGLLRGLVRTASGRDIQVRFDIVEPRYSAYLGGPVVVLKSGSRIHIRNRGLRPATVLAAGWESHDGARLEVHLPLPPEDEPRQTNLEPQDGELVGEIHSGDVVAASADHGGFVWAYVQLDDGRTLRWRLPPAWFEHVRESYERNEAERRRARATARS